MATPAELRSWIVQLSDNAERDLADLWSQLDASTVRDGLFDVMPALVGDYGDASATLSAEWYDEYRTDTNVDGFYAADLTDLSLGAESLAGWGASLAEKNWDSALSLISGGLVKRVMTASRDTITGNTDLDPRARGWMRVGHPECGWCAMLISRGAVYRGRATADFAAHDNCKCGCCPAWSTSQITAVRNEFVPTARRRSEQVAEADRARANAWITANL